MGTPPAVTMQTGPADEAGRRGTARAPRMSVVTPTRNRREAVLRAIASMQAQTLVDHEHIVVDDASTDGTLEALRALDDPRLVVLALPEWRGGNAARNAGIAAARAGLVAFLDSDDVFLPTRLESSVARFDADPTLALAIGSFDFVRAHDVVRVANRTQTLGPADLEMALVAETIAIAGSAIAARREALLEVGGFDETLARLQDRDLLLRLARRHGALLTPEVEWIKYESADSISRDDGGYLPALAALVERHPRYDSAHADLLAYVVGRHVIGHLRRRDLTAVLRDLAVCRTSEALARALRRIPIAYRAGKRTNRALRARILDVTVTPHVTPVPSAAP
jgi:glycosyltransferase involved in cell wall biosynthesis